MGLTSNPPLQPFGSWAELYNHIGAGLPVWYQAPLDYRPVQVEAVIVRGRMVQVFPHAADVDPFIADAGHLDRFRRDPDDAPGPAHAR